MEVYQSLGIKFDFLIGAFNSSQILFFASCKQLGTYNVCVALPRSHPLAKKKKLSITDLYNEKLLCVSSGDCLNIDDFRKDAFATGIHAYLIQKKYPHSEIAFSCPRLRPIINNDKINPKDVHEPQLLQIICAYRLFMPFASITISTRECERFRNNIINIAATKISAGVGVGVGGHGQGALDPVGAGGAGPVGGVSTGIGSHVEELEDKGDEQFEISDSRSVSEVYNAIKKQGLTPVMSEYIYV